MSGSSGGFSAEEIRLCYRYLKEAEQLATGPAKSSFREASPVEKQAILDKAQRWVAGLPAMPAAGDGVVAATSPARPGRGRPRRATAADTRAYSVLLPLDDLAALQALSQAQGESVSFHIREAIRRYLRDRSKGKS
jgi:hypothetical protein